MSNSVKLIRAVYRFWWRFHRMRWNYDRTIAFEDGARAGFPHVANAALTNLINRETVADRYSDGSWVLRHLRTQPFNYDLVYKANRQFARLPFDGGAEFLAEELKYDV